jgi:hypothetical protein
MELLLVHLVRPYAAEVLGFAACAATLLTFAQTRMWPMRISAIAANLFFIGYGALGLLYPVLFLHLVLLPLNVVRLIQIVQQNKTPYTPVTDLPRCTLVPQQFHMTRLLAPLGREHKAMPAGHLSTMPTLWDAIKSTPP